MNVAIIGKNSRLYSSVAHQLKPHQSLSHKEIDRLIEVGHQFDVVYLFSLPPELEVCDFHCKLNILAKKCVIIGSTAAYSSRFSKFKYSRIKKWQLNFCLENRKNFFYITFGNFDVPRRSGSYYKSNLSDLVEIINQAQAFHGDMFELIESRGNAKMLYATLETIMGVRISAAIFKYFTNLPYGYNRVE